MKYTVNYNLKKPEGTDIVNIDDLNDNADILDQKLKEVENKADNAPPNSVNDAAIGSRTPNQSQAPVSPGTGTLTQLISWLANRIKAITGKTNWWDAPPTTLQAAKTHMDAAAPHSGHATTAALDNHVNNKNNPHGVTPSQIGAETPAGAQAKIEAHEVKAAPHSGHATTTALNNHVADKDNPHSVTAAQIGAETPAGAQAKVAAHAGTGGSAHATATQDVAGFMSPADKAKLDGLDASDFAEAVAEVDGKRAGYAVYAP